MAMTATLAMMVSACTALADEPPDRVWRSDGYGWIYSLSGDHLQIYETTEISCLRGRTLHQIGSPTPDGVTQFGRSDIPSQTLRKGPNGQASLHLLGTAADVDLVPLRGLPSTCSRNVPDALTLQVASRLTDKPYVAFMKQPRIDPRDPSRHGRLQTVTITPANSPRYTGPVSLLTSELTISAGEILVQAMMGRTPAPGRIGTPTQGVFADDMQRTLPNGWTFTVGNEEYVGPDGRNYEGVGIPPTVTTPVFTAEELNHNRDSALDASSSSGALKTISVRISNDKIEGAPARVELNRGEEIRIEVTSDRSDEVHVHGYDKELTLAPGKTGVLQFVADVPGEFEVETHRSGLLLFHLVVRG